MLVGYARVHPGKEAHLALRFWGQLAVRFTGFAGEEREQADHSHVPFPGREA
jgi:hypothetical protein